MTALTRLAKRLFNTAATPAEPVPPRHGISDGLLVSRARINGKTGDVTFVCDDGTPVSRVCAADIANA